MFRYVRNRVGMCQICIMIDAGSIYETRGIRGISHLLEHLLFKSTDKLDSEALIRRITVMGGNINAVTDRDLTHFYIRTPMENFAEALEVLHGIVFDLSFTDKDLATEKKVVIEELLSQDHSSPEALLYGASYESLFGKDNPYRHSVGGEAKGPNGVSAISRRDVEGYHEAMYTYANARVVVGFDGPKKEAKAHVDRVFCLDCGPDPRPSSSYRRIDVARYLDVRPTIRFADAPEGQAQNTLRLTFPSPPVTEVVSIAALNLAKHVLCLSGLGSVLTRTLREDLGLVYNVTCTSEDFRHTGMCQIMLSSSSRDMTQIVVIILKALEDLRRDGLDASRFEFFKTSYMNTLKMTLSDTKFHTFWNGFNLFYGLPNMSVKSYLDVIDRRVDPAAFRDILRTVFDPTTMGIAILGNLTHADKTRMAEVYARAHQSAF